VQGHEQVDFGTDEQSTATAKALARRATISGHAAARISPRAMSPTSVASLRLILVRRQFSLPHPKNFNYLNFHAAVFS
jgi:hypothetical protein